MEFLRTSQFQRAALFAISTLITSQSVLLSAQRAAEAEAARDAALAEAAAPRSTSTDIPMPEPTPTDSAVWVSGAFGDSLPPRWWGGVVEAAESRAALSRFIPAPLTAAIITADSPDPVRFGLARSTASTGRAGPPQSCWLRLAQTTGPPA